MLKAGEKEKKRKWECQWIMSTIMVWLETICFPKTYDKTYICSCQSYLSG